MNPTPANVRQVDAARTLSFALPAAGGQVLLSTTGVPWIDGSAHPIDDLTHVCALLAIGVAAALLGGRSRWGVPVLFGLLLTFGLVLGSQGAVVPMSDTIVLTTAFALALLLLSRVRLLFAVIAVTTGSFALFHGVADGLSMRASHVVISYVAGYALANACLIAAAVGIGDWIRRRTIHWGEHLHHLLDRMHGLRSGG